MNKDTAQTRDPADMRGLVLAWPDLLRRGYQTELDLPDSLRGKARIVCAGMGGSAIGASLVGEYLADQLKVSYQVVRDYDLPAYVDADTLVLAISNSGNTEETLAAYDQARQRGSAVLAVATGGTLLERAAADEVPAVKFELDSQPRAALPMTLGLLLRVFQDLGYCDDQSQAVTDAAAAVSEAVELADQSDGTDKALAEAMAGRIPFVYGAGFLGEAARRLKGQISENGKQTAAFEVFPEQNHNALVGFEFPEKLLETAVFILLRSELEHPRHALRFEITKDLLQERNLPYEELHGSGAGKFAHLCTVCFWGDLASVELAYRNGTDPTPVDVIGGLKERLAKG